MIQAQRNKYMENTIQTATPGQLLIMLCDGAIRYCRVSIEALRARNYQDANTNLIKVQDIISEFSITIDRNAPIAADLLSLYEYFNHRLIEANIKKSIEPAEEVLGFLIQLKETWLQAAKQVNASSAAPAGALHG